MYDERHGKAIKTQMKIPDACPSWTRESVRVSEASSWRREVGEAAFVVAQEAREGTSRAQHADSVDLRIDEKRSAWRSDDSCQRILCVAQ